MQNPIRLAFLGILFISACGGASSGAGTTNSWPNDANTGVPFGTPLAVSGSIIVTTDGAVIENLDITGSITVLANNVTIRKVRLTSGDYYPIRYFDNNNTGLLVEDSEIIGLSGDVTSAIAFQHYTARRLNIHGMADGLKADADVLIEDCWIHNLSNGPTEHNDGVQSPAAKPSPSATTTFLARATPQFKPVMWAGRSKT
jgi:hypothetical protein